MAHLIMVGQCPKCGQTVKSRFPFELAECPNCNPPVEVKLELAILPAPPHLKQLREIAEFRKTSVKKLVAELLDVWL